MSLAMLEAFEQEVGLTSDLMNIEHAEPVRTDEDMSGAMSCNGSRG